ncbi:hypothetical protein BDZ91DRAFT_361325 [Kalaharituber pfeilii]|nr:hypothetical protein BDZ91DRAFT_361325 [Kalaharituber pfeilii]
MVENGGVRAKCTRGHVKKKKKKKRDTCRHFYSHVSITLFTHDLNFHSLFGNIYILFVFFVLFYINTRMSPYGLWRGFI